MTALSASGWADHVMGFEVKNQSRVRASGHQQEAISSCGQIAPEWLVGLALEGTENCLPDWTMQAGPADWLWSLQGIMTPPAMLKGWSNHLDTRATWCRHRQTYLEASLVGLSI